MFTGKSQLWVGKESSKEPLVMKHGKLGNSLSVEVFNGKIIAGTELRTAVDSTIHIFIYDHLWFLDMHQVSINNGIKKFFIISCTWKASEKSLLAVWRWRWYSWYDVVFAGQQKGQNKTLTGEALEVCRNETSQLSPVPWDLIREIWLSNDLVRINDQWF